MNNFILISEEDFRAIIKEELKALIPAETPQEEDRLIDRFEVCDMLKITLATLNTYSKQGIIPSYKIGARKVRYKHNEVLKSLKKKRKVKSIK
jgi:predicted DNA-binding transcriptional regulator AlpA